MKWYKFNLTDYYKATAHIGDADDLCYRRLIDLYYLSETPIKDDLVAISKHVKMDPEVVLGVLEEFFTLTPKGWVHEEIQEDVDRRLARSLVNRQSGSRGGRPPKAPKNLN